MTLRARPAPKLVAYATLGTLFLLAGIVLSRVEASELGVVFLAAAIIGLALARRPNFRVTARLATDAVLEGEHTAVELEVVAPTGVPWLELTLPAPAELGLRGRGRRRDAVSVVRMSAKHLEVGLKPRRWGLSRIGPVSAIARDGLGFFVFEWNGNEQLVLRVFPREERVARAIRPAETQLFSGDEVSRRKGDGIEFAGVREFGPGDTVRRINWPVSTRTQKLHINDLHPERNADVIVFLDAFSDFGRGDDSTLLMAVRATATVARHYLRRRDRVGLVSFGGTLRWQLPSMGLRQAYRIIDALLSTDAMLSYAWKGIDVIPAQTLPPKALVIAISPLLDARTISALLELRGRGFDLVVVEVSPAPFIEPPRTADERLAYRLWVMRREAARFDFWRAGVPVTLWTKEQPLVAALQEVEGFRRSVRKLRIS